MRVNWIRLGVLLVLVSAWIVLAGVFEVERWVILLVSFLFGFLTPAICKITTSGPGR